MATSNKLAILEAKVPPGASKDQAKLMLQRALEERFKLVLHHEQRQFKIWALVIAKEPPKLKEAADPNAPPKIGGQARDGIRHDTFRGVRISKTDPNDSTVSLDMFLGLYWAAMRKSPAGTLPTVADTTGLAGKYDFDLEYVFCLRNPRRPRNLVAEHAICRCTSRCKVIPVAVMRSGSFVPGPPLRLLAATRPAGYSPGEGG